MLRDDTSESIYYVLAMLNSPHVFDWLSDHGVIKGGIVEFSEKPINSIPIRRIDWSNASETMLHDEISVTCQRLIAEPDETKLDRLHGLIHHLLC